MFAQNIQFKHRFPQEVSIRFAFKVSPFVQPVPVEKNVLKLGMLEGVVPVTCLLEVMIGSQEIGNFVGIGFHHQ